MYYNINAESENRTPSPECNHVHLQKTPPHPISLQLHWST